MLIEMTVPRTSSAEGIQQLKQRHPGALFVMFTLCDDARMLEALRLGVCVYLLSTAPPPDLMKTLRELASGTTAVSSDIARSVIGLLPRVHASCPTKFGLTPHEIRLLALLVDGYTFKAVAVMAGLKPSTVAWHMQRIYGKLQVHSKSEAVATALRNGITSSQMTEYR